MKHCFACNTTKPKSEFNKNRATKDGFQSQCRLCIAKWRKANPDRIKIIKAAWRKANPDKVKAQMDAWKKANPDKVKAKIAAWKKANPAKLQASKAAWKKANPDKVNAYNAKRRAAKLQAMLKYGKEAHKKEIDIWYKRAKLASTFMNEDYHVDHIVPLQGKTVSGLHVPWNLQLLTKIENIKKGNKHAN